MQRVPSWWSTQHRHIINRHYSENYYAQTHNKRGVQRLMEEATETTSCRKWGTVDTFRCLQILKQRNKFYVFIYVFSLPASGWTHPQKHWGIVSPGYMMPQFLMYNCSLFYNFTTFSIHGCNHKFYGVPITHVSLCSFIIYIVIGFKYSLTTGGAQRISANDLNVNVNNRKMHIFIFTEECDAMVCSLLHKLGWGFRVNLN